MEFEWLVALAYPRAIAVHPNFASQGVTSGPSTLASHVLHETFRQTGESASPDPSMEFAGACVRTLTDPSSAQAEGLKVVVEDRNVDLGRRACAAIILSAVGGEKTLPPRDLFASLIGETARQTSVYEAVTHLWLRLAAASVAADYGEESTDEFHSIRVSFEHLKVSDGIELQTAKGLQLTPALVTERIVDFLRDAALQQEIRTQPLGEQLWKKALRRPTPLLLGQLYRRLGVGYEEWSKRTFLERFQRNTEVLGGSSLPGDDSMTSVVMISTFCAHPFARQAALELARSRLIRAQQLGDSELRTQMITSSLPLLRFSRNKEATNAAAKHVLRHGPLSALLQDIEKVLSTIERRGHTSQLELEYLTEVATLFSAEQATSALSWVVAEFEGSSPSVVDRWTASWARSEALAKLLGQLSRPAGAGMEFVRLVVSQLAPDGSEEEDRRLSTALRSAPDLKNAELMVLLHGLRGNSGYPGLRALMVERLGEEVVSDHLPREAQADGLASAIKYINNVIVGRDAVSTIETSQHLPAVRSALVGVQDQAQSGMRVLGAGSEPIDVAVAYATLVSGESLWPLIVELLADPQVSRKQKSAALQRIASSPELVPENARSLLNASLSAMFATPATMFDEGGNPFPSALRAAVGLRLVHSNELIRYIGPWLSSSKSELRSHASSVIASVPARDVPAWAVQSLLTLTYDADPDVQADAIQVLTYLYPHASAMQDLIAERANDLLSGDGTWLLRKVLEELKVDAARSLRERLRTRVSALERHVDCRVRTAAGSVARSSV